MTDGFSVAQADRSKTTPVQSFIDGESHLSVFVLVRINQHHPLIIFACVCVCVCVCVCESANLNGAIYAIGNPLSGLQ